MSIPPSYITISPMSPCFSLSYSIYQEWKERMINTTQFQFIQNCLLYFFRRRRSGRSLAVSFIDLLSGRRRVGSMSFQNLLSSQFRHASKQSLLWLHERLQDNQSSRENINNLQNVSWNFGGKLNSKIVKDLPVCRLALGSLLASNCQCHWTVSDPAVTHRFYCSIDFCVAVLTNRKKNE